MGLGHEQSDTPWRRGAGALGEELGEFPDAGSLGHDVAYAARMVRRKGHREILRFERGERVELPPLLAEGTERLLALGAPLVVSPVGEAMPHPGVDDPELPLEGDRAPTAGRGVVQERLPRRGERSEERRVGKECRSRWS